MFCEFSKPDCDCLTLVAVTFEVPPVCALPMPIFCELSRPLWLWLIFDALTSDLPHHTPADRRILNLFCLPPPEFPERPEGTAVTVSRASARLAAAEAEAITSGAWQSPSSIAPAIS